MGRLLGRTFFAAIVVYFLYHDDLQSQDKTLVIENDPNAQVMAGGFTLNSEGTVNIKARWRRWKTGDQTDYQFPD